jgi:hypothetical protein
MLVGKRIRILTSGALTTFAATVYANKPRLRRIWTLFNSFTEVLKGNLNELPKRTEALHGLLDSYVGLSQFRQN